MMKSYVFYSCLHVLLTFANVAFSQNLDVPKHKTHPNDAAEPFRCVLDDEGIKYLNDAKEKAIIKKFGSVERWKAERQAKQARQLNTRAATCDLKVEIVKLGTASNMSTTALNTYTAKFGDGGGEFTHPTNISVVANSVVVPNLYDIFPTALRYVPTAGTAGQYYIQSENALFEDLPNWTGFASNQTNQTIVLVPPTWNGPDGLKPLRIILGVNTFASGVNPGGSTDGSSPALAVDKTDFNHGFMLVAASASGSLFIHETGHGLGLNHDNTAGNYMQPAPGTATQFIPAHRVVGSISLRMAGPTGTNGSNGLSYFTSQCTATALSVELIDFQGINEGEQNRLTWQTASETNNQYFDIERSGDRSTFGSIGTVKGQGTTRQKTDYQFSDRHPLSINYYRLRQIDKDGKETLSKIISINNNKKRPIHLFPNPTTGKIYLTTNLSDITETRIYNAVGQLMNQHKTLNNNEIDVSTLPSGVYQIELRNAATQVVHRQRIIKN